MRTKLFALSMIAIITLMFLSGCSKEPQEALKTTESAIEAARTAEVDRYLPEDYKSALDSLNKAQTEIEKQKSKFALTRSFGYSETLLNSAKHTLDVAVTQVEAKKEQTKKDVETMVATIDSTISEINNLFKVAPRGKEGKMALVAIQNDVKTVQGSLSEVNDLMNQKNYLAARDKAKILLEKLNSLKGELEGAIAKKGAAHIS